MKKKILVSGLLLYSFVSLATVYHISPAGSDANGNGSAGNPWKTLFKATSTVTSFGDSIYVSPGIYLETQQSLLSVGVSIYGAGKTVSILRSTLTALWTSMISAASNTQGTNGSQSISHLKLEGTNSVSWAIYIGSRSNFVIHDCDFSNFVERGIHWAGVSNTGQTTEPAVYATGNKFYNNTLTNCATFDGWGRGNLHIGGQDGMLIYNNTITQSRPPGQNGYCIKYANDGWLKNVKIYNNTFTKPPLTLGGMGTNDWPFAIEFARCYGGVEIYNNVFTGAGIDNNIAWKGNAAYSLWIHDNTIRNAAPNTFRQAAVILEFSSEFVIVENNFFENLAYGILFTPRSLTENAWSGNIKNITIQKNLMAMTDATSESGGNFIFGYADAGANKQYNWNGINIYNNTMIWKPGFSSIWGIGFPFSAAGGAIKNWNIKNNILAGSINASVVFCGNCGNVRPDSIDISNNDLYNNGNNNMPLWLNSPVPTNYTYLNNINVIPTFLPLFRLPAGSPLIDAGQDVSLPFLGAAPDIGYDEFTTVAPLPCNSWLSTPSINSNARIGDLDVSGNQITVEANFNRTAAANPGGGFGFLVSKHNSSGNVNYSLSPEGCSISTVNGNVTTGENCSTELNKTYHAALVYDGASLKFYRNGFLQSQTPASGNLVINDLITTIGQNVPEGASTIFPFLGHINEVRVWNVARTRAQIRSYMNATLPNPATQAGLLGYYVFNNLLNKQGNTAYNATLNGAATILSTNPNCNFTADTCAIPPPSPGTGIIINDYTAAQALNLCTNKLSVEDAVKFNIGDTVLMIQMKGAAIDSSNTAAFGNITDYRNAGNYEFNYVKSKSGNVLELTRRLSRSYDITNGKVQLIRVPYFNNLTITDTLTCLPWDGNKGGILVFNVLNNLSLNGNIDVSGKGFKGAAGFNPGTTTNNCSQNGYNYPINSLLAAQKGESITTISNNIINGKGSPAGGGGGGLGHNSGGGGGGNGGPGGMGGNQLEACGTSIDNRGIGGNSLAYNSSTNKIFMGSGGGAGHADNAGNIPPAGGNGAGIIIISAERLISNSKKIIANGAAGKACTMPASPDCLDGMGGGGAGGSILLNVNQYSDNASIETRGGKGADMVGSVALGGRIAAGGGGSGGVVFFKSGTFPAAVTVNNTGGVNGVLTMDGNSSWGATPGTSGMNLYNLSIPLSTSTFQKNIDSVRIKDSLLICRTYDFKGLAYVNYNVISSWQWDFGNGNTATAQNTTQTYATAGTYQVRLIVSDINGCKDTVTKSVTIAPTFIADAGFDVALCASGPIQVPLKASAGTTYAWSPANLLNNAAIVSPTANVTATTWFYVTITNAQGCTARDSVLVTIHNQPANSRYPDVNAFIYQPMQLQARNLSNNIYQWIPSTGLNNNLIGNPTFTQNEPKDRQFIIDITTNYGCRVTDTLLVKAKGSIGIYVPKAFSPNGDGNNDRLYPLLVGIQQFKYFRVFNRWGNLIFETNSSDPSAGWDGTLSGKLQPSETYTWSAAGVNFEGFTITKSGNTFLMR